MEKRVLVPVLALMTGVSSWGNPVLGDAEGLGHTYLRELASLPQFLQGHFLGNESGGTSFNLLAALRTNAFHFLV